MQSDLSFRVEGERLLLEGSVTETANFAPVLAKLGPKSTLNLSHVVRMNSIGVREWINFVRQAAGAGRALTLERCSPAVVEQLNMIADFKGEAAVRSVLAPCLCSKCGREQQVLVETAGDVNAQLSGQTCSACSGPLELDDLPERYFSFLGR